MAERERETAQAEAMGAEAEIHMDDEDEEEGKEREFVIRIRPPKLLPSETASHVRAAQKEMLLAVRSVLDALIDRVEEPEKRRKRRSKIEVG